MQLAFGLFLLLIVVSIWVASAELTEYIFSDENFSKPYFLTYLSASCFSLYLGGFAFKPRWRADLYALLRRNTAKHTAGPEQDPLLVNAGNGNEHEIEHEEESSGAHPEAESQRVSREAAPDMLSMRETVIVALKFVALWFSANYIYNVSLVYTSVASNTILSATSSFFTLIFGALFPGTIDDRFSFPKLVCVLLSIGGVVMVSLSDSERGGDTAAGDGEAVASAMLYGVYLVFLRRQTGSRNIDMMLFLAFFGLFTLLLVWPGLLVVHFAGIEPFEWPSGRTWLFLLTIALIGTVLSELLWLHATLITTPVISTVAVSVSIPVAIIADHVLGMRQSALTWMYFIGTAMLFLSFLVLAALAHNPLVLHQLWARLSSRAPSSTAPTSTLAPTPSSP
eukprot:m.234525 g.234525  ORF g.234525 m.234525 type:complete len:395 (-) comp19641_c0_seq1:36-1220(-)